MNKKTKKGFTMVEMLGIVVVIALISIFSFPMITTLSNQSKQKKYDNFLSVLNNAADTYIELNFEKYNNLTAQYISVKKLVEEGLINENLVNPNTKLKVTDEDGIVVITKNIDKTMSYSYSLNEYFQIKKVEDLVRLSNNVASGNTYYNKIVILVNDIDFNNPDSYEDATSTSFGNINEDTSTNSLLTELTTINGFNPIGDSSHPFKGTFVGDGHAINNLYINRTSETEVGLFSTIDSGEVNGLKLKGSVNGSTNTGLLAGKIINNSEIKDVDVDFTTTSNASNVGGLAGYATNITLNNINSNYQINSSASNAGGIIGNITISGGSSNTTESLKSNGMISGSGNNVGGIFGNVTNTIITNAESDGRITGATGVGGIAGNISASTSLENMTNRSSISASSKGGGLFGISSNSTIRKSNNAGGVYGNNTAGGLIGEMSGSTLELSYSTSLVNGTSITGGLVGSMISSTLTNTYNIGNVSGTSKVGGLVGNSSASTLNDSYTTGNITGTSEVGGLIGVATSSTQLNRLFYNIDNTSQQNLVGTNTGTNNNSRGLNSIQMKVQSYYNSWDFANIWQIQIGSYPTLR